MTGPGDATAPRGPGRPAVGRADLVRAWAGGGEAGLAAMARLLRYEAIEGAELAEGADGAAAAPGGFDRRVLPGATATEEKPGERLAPIPFWRLEELVHLEPESEAETSERPAAVPIGPSGIGVTPGRHPRTPPLVPEARLWPALRRRLASTLPSREVDVQRLAEDWSRGRLARRIPYRPVAAWAPRVTVVVDRSERLIPFWDDQDHLLRLLRRRLGHGAVGEVHFHAGRALPWRDHRGHHARPPWLSGVPVLLLGDLGCLAGSEERALWRGLGLRRRQSRSRSIALTPCPAVLWEVPLARLWDALDWTRPRGAPWLGAELEPGTRRARAERLLALTSFASRVEPGLLRAIRRLLPAEEADAGTEADAWAHPEFNGGSSVAGELRAEARLRLQPRFAHEPDFLKLGVVEAMRAWRAGQPEEIWLVEVLGLAAAGRLPPGALLAGEIEAARKLWRRLAATVAEEAGPSAAAPGTAARPAVLGFVRRSLVERLPREVWLEPELQRELWRAWQAAWAGEGDAPLPAGVGPEIRGGDPSRTRRHWRVGQEGAALRVAAAEASVGRDVAKGSPLAELIAASPEVAVSRPGDRLAGLHPLESTTAIPLAAAPALVLRTDRTVATLHRITRPQWASAMGRDVFGLWASFEVGGVEQRMRWIPPGRFRMGSPEGEPGRWAAEAPRHLEVIPHGFWLADTPCTQEVWEVVTGENPSRFQTPGRPVEQVSWEDCQAFCRALDEKVPGLEARLPLECEWEYACRAGTETATYAGPIEILGERNAPILDDIAWYGGNSGVDYDLEEFHDSSDWPEKQHEHSRAGTRLVAQKEANPWGLYDMLGNVFEWCGDLWRDDYEAEPQGSVRVDRGGSWYSDARFVRAAVRVHGVPSNRWNYRGFRLARGQGALGHEAEPGSAERGRGGARRGTRRRGRGSLPGGGEE